MLRIGSRWCVVLSLLFANALTAQETYSPIGQELEDSAQTVLPTTPEILAQLEESRKAVEALPDQVKISALFQLLSIELRFADKQPAKNTIQKILSLIPSAEKESVQAQVFEAVAVAQTNIGDYTESVKTLDRIAKTNFRAEKQLNVAGKIIEDTEKNKPEKPFDVTDLLRQSLAGAVETKDVALEALVNVILGREQLKQGKIDEAKITLAKARKKAREIEEIEERNLVALIVQSLANYGQSRDAQAMIETVADDEMKQNLRGIVAVVLAENGKIDEAQNLAKTFKPSDLTDEIILRIVQAAAKTITAVKFQELAQLASSPEGREALFTRAFQILWKNKREDVAAELAEQLLPGITPEKTAEIRQMINFLKFESLVDAKKFDEAAQILETFDVSLKPVATRNLLLYRFREDGKWNDDLLNQMSVTFSAEEKKQIESLRAESEKASQIENIENRFNVLFQIFGTQWENADVQGCRRTLGLMFDAIEKSPDPALIVKYRLDLLSIQSQLNDKAGVRENLVKLLQFLDGVKDVMTLKDLVPEEQEEPRSQQESSRPVLTLKPPVDESAVWDAVFSVYLSAVVIAKQTGADSETKKAFEKAKTIADSENDALRKVEKLLTLSLLLADIAR
jgi:hypothetical protein